MQSKYSNSSIGPKLVSLHGAVLCANTSLLIANLQSCS